MNNFISQPKRRFQDTSTSSSISTVSSSNIQNLSKFNSETLQKIDSLKKSLQA